MLPLAFNVGLPTSISPVNTLSDRCQAIAIAECHVAQAVSKLWVLLLLLQKDMMDEWRYDTIHNHFERHGGALPRFRGRHEPTIASFRSCDAIWCRSCVHFEIAMAYATLVEFAHQPPHARQHVALKDE